MLSLEEALQKLLSSVRPIDGAEQIPLPDAIGRIVAADIHAPNPLPLFDNSAMDGWAVRSADVSGASKDSPVTLESIANVPAGALFDGEIAVGQCARIFTGSPMPRGADAVVMQEDARAELPRVHVFDAVKPWENVRFRGEDMKEGALLTAAGSRIYPQIAALLSACGVGQVAVKRRPRIAVLATGNELKQPGETLHPGEIFESNRLLISSLAKKIGVEAIEREIVRDDLASTIRAIREVAANADAVITCGGVSVGEYDFVKAAVSELGVAIDFWQVAIKPGKPFAHATVSGKPLFGLPGNPVSGLVTFWLLVRPALLRMAGASDLAPAVSYGVLAEEIANRGDRRHFVRVSVDFEGNVRVSGPQASHRLGSLAAANALLDVPPETTWEIGRQVKTILLP
ncbi:MAG TPA: gephyrin-like molybdotransferase Glp [Verrucomicrobiae bacterium]